jgi:hypothetical protein
MRAQLDILICAVDSALDLEGHPVVTGRVLEGDDAEIEFDPFLDLFGLVEVAAATDLGFSSGRNLVMNIAGLDDQVDVPKGRLGSFNEQFGFWPWFVLMKI